MAVKRPSTRPSAPVKAPVIETKFSKKPIRYFIRPLGLSGSAIKPRKKVGMGAKTEATEKNVPERLGSLNLSYRA